MNIDLFGEQLKAAVQWIPFTYSYSIINSTVLTGGIPNLIYILGLLGYIVIFFILGLAIYKKFIFTH